MNWLRFIRKIPVVNFGFYSGVFFGLALSVFLTVFVVSSASVDLPESVFRYFSFVFGLLGSVFGGAFVVVCLLGYVSHLVRHRYNLVCGCVASSYFSSGDDPEEGFSGGELV